MISSNTSESESDNQSRQIQNKKSSSLSCFLKSLTLFVLVRFQVWVILLLFGCDSLPFVGRTVFVHSFGAWLDTHYSFPVYVVFQSCIVTS